MPKKVSVRKNQSFLHGALILTTGVAAVKVINALFKIPLFWILGAEGNGYFTAAYDLYTMLYTIATAGFPIAISRMVSASITKNRFKDVKQIHKVSIPLFITTGLIGFSLMVGATFIYSRITSSPGVVYSALVLSPTVFFYCMMSIYRGYYEGLRNMYPTAISEVIEAICKLIVGLSASYIILELGMNSYHTTGQVFGVVYESESLAKSAILPLSAAGAILGTTFGAFVGFIFLLIRHKKFGDGITTLELQNSLPPKTEKNTLIVLIKMAIPIAMGALVLNISGFIDAMFIQNRLVHIMNTNQQTLVNIYTNLINEKDIALDKIHTTLYGCYGSATTIMMVVPAITATFGISALPSVTSAWVEGVHKKIKNSIESVIRITTIITIPAGVTLTVMAKPIAELLYLKSNNQYEVNVVANVLEILGIAGIFLSTSTPLCSMLQAVGRVDLPVKLLGVGVLIKIILNYIFVSIPQINIQGAGAGTLICYMFITCAALYLLCKETKIVPNLMSVFLKPLLSSICCAGSAWIFNNLLSFFINSHRLVTIISLIIGVIIYVISLFIFNTINKNDVLMLPKGEKIVKTLEKHRLLR